MPTTFTVTVADDAKATRMVDAFAATYGYPAQVPDPAWVDPKDGSAAPLVPNPQTRKQFVQQGLKRHLREVARAYEIQQAQAAAAIAADTLGDV